MNLMLIRDGRTPHGHPVKQPNGYVVGFDLVLSRRRDTRYTTDEMHDWCAEHIGVDQKDFVLYGGYMWFATESSAMLFKMQFG
ncbi:MAG: hypothetical protein EOP83_11505 [Verrucomicrobiaceae bacterium]|nr:MAG: hypothetical protein EOP83_11505 [Verrucomicrobiaceae bacterium]